MTIATAAKQRAQAEEAKRRRNEKARTHRKNAAAKPDLGYRPAFGDGWWQRTPPSGPGAFPVAPRDAGFWGGETRRAGAAWHGWWWSRPIGSTSILTRLPPLPDWDEVEEAR